MPEKLGVAPLRERYARLSSFLPSFPRVKDIPLKLRRVLRSFGALPWLPVLASFLALRALLARGSGPLGYFDEGLLFSDAYLLRKGLIPYVDFHVCYPPGVLQIVRAVLGLHLPAIWTVRLLALLVRIGSAVVAGHLVGQAHGSRFCFWTCAVVLIMQEQLGLVLYAYPIALLLGLLVVATWPTLGAPRWKGITCGVLLGCLSYVRHDLFVYGCTVLAGVEGAWWVVKRESFFIESPERRRDFLLALIGTAFALWAPVLLRSGISRPLHDIVIDMATRIMPGRKLPFPPMAEMWHINLLNLDVPAGMGEINRLGLTFAIAGAVAISLAVLIRGARALRADAPAVTPTLRRMALIAAFTFGALPQATFRFDYPHVAYSIPVTITALLMAAGARWREPVFILSLMPWFTAPPQLIGWESAKQLWRERADDHFVPADRLEIARFVQKETKPGEPFFSACYSHRRTLASNMDLYYLARRPNATRYMIFDPGTTAAAEGQREMIADLERTRPKLVIRGPGCVWDEPNDSIKEGSPLLDEYLEKHYALDKQIGSWHVWRPKTAS